MRHAPLALTAAALALTACEQTLHLYATTDAGGLNAGGAGGAAGKVGTGGFGFGTGGGSGGQGGFAGDPHCQGSGTTIQYTPDVPRMVIALDRSTSMVTQNLGMYSQLATALNAVQAQVYDYGYPGPNHSPPAVQFSFIAFPDTDPNSCSSQVGCCASSVQTDWNSFDGKVTGCTSPSSTCLTSSSHSISAALSKALTTLNSGSFTNSPRYVVLISDGSPSGNCASNDCSDAQGFAMTLNSAGVTLFVVGVGDQSTADMRACLPSLAASGGNAARYYAATSENDLFNVLGEITAGALCNVTLMNGPSSASSLQVSVGFMSISPNSQDGWMYDPGSQRLRLLGKACMNYATYGNTLLVTTGCKGNPGP
jgi:hypothetical protein